nr:hypothetical protein [Tanacetum cinerariifolium]
MALTFADTHNMIVYLTKSDASEGFDQIINFLNASAIRLVRNVDSSSKFYMYPRFLQLMIRAQVGNLSSHTTKYLSPTLTQKVFVNMKTVGNGFSRVETPLFEGMLVPQQAANDIANVAADDVNDVVAEDATEPTSPLPTPPPPQELPSTSQVAPTPPPLPIAQPSSPLQQQQPLQPTTVSMDLLNTLLETWGIIADLDADKDVTLEEVDTTKDVEVENNANVQGRLEDAARRRKGVMIRDPEKTATPSTIVHSEQKSKDKGKGIMVQEPKPLKKQAQIEQDEAYARELEA